MNPMRDVKIEKVTLNIGVGEGGDKLVKAEKVMEKITGRKPTRTFAKKSVRDFKIRLADPIGCKATFRGQEAEKILKRTFEAVEKKLSSRVFDTQGNFSFGVKEHIDIVGVDYDPEIGIFGLDVCVTLCRPGYRIKHRRCKQRDIPTAHRVTKDDAINFVSQKFGVQVV